MDRLASRHLAALPADVEQPGYDRAEVATGIVHLGIGAFHRAHQAAYFNQLIAIGDPRWGIVGVSMRSSTVADQLNPQDGLYTLVNRAPSGETLSIIGAVKQVLVCGQDTLAILRLIADPAVQIVSLTVTEKGYCHDPATGELRNDHNDIVHDLALPGDPRSAIGLLAEGLDARRAAGAGPLTILSCDNLPDNGKLLAGLVLDFAQCRSADLAAWIADNVSFPCTMIDRIVPATKDADRDALAARLGVRDEAMVKAEPFTQWVVEDHFAGARPPLDQVGVRIVDDVRPFELAKLRMLNGSHSLIAYTGLLRGHVTVDAAIADPFIRSLVDRLMVEAAATLPAVPGLDPADYAQQLIDRFANPALDHRLAQIAMDGSQKLPQRLIGTIADQLRNGAQADASATGVAAWLLHLNGPFLDDPLATPLRELADKADGGVVDLVRRACRFAPVFGDVGRNPAFVDLLCRSAVRLSQMVERA